MPDVDEDDGVMIPVQEDQWPFSKDNEQSVAQLNHLNAEFLVADKLI